jgi:DNA polymerase-3 subunit epsilon
MMTNKKFGGRMKLTEATWVFLDTETTGLKPEEGARVIEFGAVSIVRMEIANSWDFLINPEGSIPAHITKITGIRDTDVEKKPFFKDVASALMQTLSTAEFIAAYNKDFDRKMLEAEFKKIGMTMPNKVWLDPLTWARHFDREGNKLTQLVDRFKVKLDRAHRADADAEAGARVLIEFFNWGVDEAAFPDDVEALKDMERDWRKDYSAQGRILNPLKQSVDGKRQVVMTGTPGKYAQNVYDNHIRDRFNKLHEMGKWRK